MNNKNNLQAAQAEPKERLADDSSRTDDLSAEKGGKSRQQLTQGAEVAAKEINGPRGLEPTRYGDWESKGRCYDF